MPIAPLIRYLRRALAPAAFALAALSSIAGPGALDASFGNNGVAYTNISGAGGSIVGIAPQADGRILAVASSSTGSTPALELLRYLADGTLDGSFGASGRVLLASPISAVAAVRAQPDGTILVAAQDGGNMLVLRFLANGTPDASFGQAGRGAIAVSGALVSSMERMADGRIVLGGGNGGYFVAARFLANGAIDTTFNGTGFVRLNIGAAYLIGTATGLAVRPDGRVLLAGTAFRSFSYFGGTVVGLTVDGLPDVSFGNVGIINVSYGMSSGARTLALQADGKVLVTGFSFGDAYLRRLNANGSDDTTFNATGILLNPSGGLLSTLAEVVAQPDGKILAFGTRPGAHVQFGAVRFLADGSIDSTFNGTGGAGVAVGTLDAVYADAVVQPDGAIVFAGYGAGQPARFALARLTAAGAVDTTFGGTGSITTTALGGSDDAARAVAIQPDGRIVTAGTTRPESFTRFAVSRQLADGSPDTSFNSTGSTSTAIRTRNDVARVVAVQPDGRIVAAGTSFNGANDDIALVRYNVDGSLDTTFNGTGIVITSFAASDSIDEANAIALQPDGKIIVVGRCGFVDGFTIVRYNADGSLDTSFNGTGKANAQGAHTIVAYAVTLLADGRIAVGGYGFLAYPYGNQFALAIFNANGTLASSWSDFVGPAFTNRWAYAIAAQPDGKILLAGGNVAGTTSEIVRLDANATALDTTFANGGRYVVPGTPIRAMSLLKDGRIVALTQDFHVFRLYPDGARDAGFGTNGETVVPFTSTPTEQAMALQPDGNLLVAGTAGTATRGNDFALARLEGNPAGDFGFVMQMAVAPSAAMTSNAVIYSGGPATISVAGGEYSIGCTNVFTSAPGPIAGGMAVCVRHTSTTAFGTATTTTLTIGTQSGTFTSITIDAGGDRDGDGIPNAVEFAEARDARVKDNDVFGNVRLFVMQQYRDVFGREGDAGGIAFWQGRIDGGLMSRAELIQAFFYSSESGALALPIARLYFATFLRTPDYGGLLFQIDAYGSGATLAQVANNFTLAPEFFSTYGALNDAQFVSLLYNNILGRAAAQSEIDFHVGRLAGGATRGEVLVGFSESPEYQGAIGNEIFVTMMYVAMLRRSPEPAGLSYWVSYLDGGNSGLALINGFLQAAEYHDRFLP